MLSVHNQYFDLIEYLWTERTVHTYDSIHRLTMIVFKGIGSQTNMWNRMCV